MRELCLEPLPEKVTDAAQLAAAGVLETPALEVDGRILVSGTVPSRDESRRMLQKALQADSPAVSYTHLDVYKRQVQGGVNILADVVAFQLPVKGRVADDVQSCLLYTS